MRNRQRREKLKLKVESLRALTLTTGELARVEGGAKDHPTSVSDGSVMTSKTTA